MARLVDYKASIRGESQLARSVGMRNMLERKGRNVAQVAQGGYDANPPHSGRVDVDVISDSTSRVGFEVARVAVIARHPAALAIEADRRVLGSAISAAKG